jgi:DNA-binding response OmpR family regulator
MSFDRAEALHRFFRMLLAAPSVDPMMKGRIPGKRVLIVEQDEDVRAVLAESLGAEGHRVTATDFGPLPAGAFGVVVTDVPSWPYRSEDARRWIRQLRDRYRGARIILCTAQRAVHREPDALGADLIVDKPFDLWALFADVACLVAGRAHRPAPIQAAAGAT